jgi:hypothetical protein
MRHDILTSFDRGHLHGCPTPRSGNALVHTHARTHVPSPATTASLSHGHIVSSCSRWTCTYQVAFASWHRSAFGLGDAQWSCSHLRQWTLRPQSCSSHGSIHLDDEHWLADNGTTACAPCTPAQVSVRLVPLRSRTRSGFATLRSGSSRPTRVRTRRSDQSGFVCGTAASATAKKSLRRFSIIQSLNRASASAQRCEWKSPSCFAP